jgi:FdhE protein
LVSPFYRHGNFHKSLFPMTDAMDTTIASAAAAIRRQLPAYAELLDFYEPLFLAQEHSRMRVRLDPPQITEPLLALKADDKFPLIRLNQFAIDRSASSSLLTTVCRLAQKSTKALADAAGTLLQALGAAPSAADALFDAMLEQDDAQFEKAAGRIAVDSRILGFFTYSSMRPSLVSTAEMLSVTAEKLAPWDKGYCPICGSPPGLSFFDGDGRRFLACSFCGHPWPMRRVVCAFCENTDSDTLGYHYSGDEDAYRIDVCDGCRKYLKGVDTRRLQHPFYPPLEQVATLHLDIKADEMGYVSGITRRIQL